MTAFKDISEVGDFQPTEALHAFATKHQVGITLLHSHHGHSQLLFCDDFSRSIPINTSTSLDNPCSWYNDKGEWKAYEWADVAISSNISSFATFATELFHLAAIVGFELGLTFRPIQNVTELEDATCPGAHIYIPREQFQPSEKDKITVTCIGPSTGGDAPQDWCQRQTDCVWSNDAQQHYQVATGQHISVPR